MTNKYTPLYQETLREKRRLDEISKILPKQEKAKGTKFYRFKMEIRALLKEIVQVRKEIAC